jgi:hypothetical protein
LPINPGSTPTELDYILDKMTPRCAIALPDFCDAPKSLGKRVRS